MLVLASCTPRKSGVVQGNADAPTISARLLTGPSGVDDKSFNAAAWNGMLSFYGATRENPVGKGGRYDWLMAQGRDQFGPLLRQSSDEKHDLVVVTGFMWAQALVQVAPLYPDSKYLIIDVSMGNLPNITGAVFAEHEGSYLCGMAAALKAKEAGVLNPKFGFIGGVAGPVLTKFEMGWVQGIRSVLPGAQIVDYYANDWSKPELAKTQAKLWFSSGVYAIFTAAGDTGGGAIAQAKEERRAGKDVWVIGVDGDRYEEGLYADGKSAVLTSMIKRVDVAVSQALAAVQSGTFKPGAELFDLKRGGVDYSTSNAAISADIRKRLEMARDAITSGATRVMPSYAEALSAGLAPEGLQASDK